MFAPAADSPAIPFQRATGFTLLRAPEHVASWRARFPNAVLLWEPVRIFMLSADHEAFLRGIAQADIVSPNLHEAQTMYGLEDEVEIMRRMLADGVKLAVLRMGELGSLVARRGDRPGSLYPGGRGRRSGRSNRRRQHLLRRLPGRLIAARAIRPWPAAMARRRRHSRWNMSAARQMPADLGCRVESALG